MGVNSRWLPYHDLQLGVLHSFCASAQLHRLQEQRMVVAQRRHKLAVAAHADGQRPARPACRALRNPWDSMVSLSRSAAVCPLPVRCTCHPQEGVTGMHRAKILDTSYITPRGSYRDAHGASRWRCGGPWGCCQGRGPPLLSWGTRCAAVCAQWGSWAWAGPGWAAATVAACT